ncbi:hypothetical protein BJD99_01100 [Rhodococcus sp. 1163]|nr:hypothetical protein BJD99_01100 [Rhodococcus sp. 1163]
MPKGEAPDMSISETKSATSPSTTMKLIPEPYLKMVLLARKQLRICQSIFGEQHGEVDWGFSG